MFPTQLIHDIRYLAHGKPDGKIYSHQTNTINIRHRNTFDIYVK